MTSSGYRNPHLLAYLAGNLASITGTWGQRVVIFWMAWELTGSTTILGVLAALDLLPSVVAAPIAGALADSRPAVRLTRNLQVLSALPPLLMAGVVLFGEIDLPILMFVMLATGILNGLDHPLRLWLVGSIVQRPHVSRAVAANSIVFNIGRMIGPAVGGWAVSAGMPALMFVGNALSFLMFAAVIATLRYAVADEAAAGSGATEARRVGWTGLRHAVEAPILLVFCLFTAMAALVRPIFELLPGFSEGLAANGIDDAQVFSLLTSAQGLGAMVGAVAASYLLSRMSNRMFAMMAALVATCGAFAFAVAGSFAIAVACLALVSGAVLANGIATQVSLQTRLPEAIRGKALSVYTMTFRGVPALGALIVGSLGEFAPLRGIFMALAAGMLALCVVALSLSQRHRGQNS